MNHRKPLASMTARSAAIIGALTLLALAGALFAFYVHPAYAQEGSAPDKPTGLFATATHDQVVLTWDDPDDDTITGYLILRRNRDTDRKGEFRELVADTGTAAVTYTDDAVVAETNYTYRIKAINKDGVSERSRWFHIDTPASPETTAVSRGHFPQPSVPEGSTDLPNNDTSTGVVAVGDPVEGTLHNNSDRDWYKVELLKGVRYQIDMEGGDSGRGTLDNPKMSLRDPDGGGIETDFRSGYGLNARITTTWDFDEPGWIEAYRESGSGSSYTISIIVLGSGRSETDANRPNNSYPDFSHNKNTDGRLDMNASVTGWITRDDKDWFRVSLVEGRQYTFDLEGVSTNRGSLSDPIMSLRNSSGTNTGTVISSVTDSTNDHADFAAGYAGYYFVSAGYAEDDPNSGALDANRTYTLSVSGDIPADDSTNAVVATDGRGALGEIESSGDVDWFAVELEAPRSYRVDLEGRANAHGTLEDTKIAGIYDAFGDEVPDTRDDDDGSGKNARVIFRVRSSGTHYIAATAGGSGTGNYHLSVRHWPLDLFSANTDTDGVVEVGGVKTKGFISEPVLTEKGRYDLVLQPQIVLGRMELLLGVVEVKWWQLSGTKYWKWPGGPKALRKFMGALRSGFTVRNPAGGPWSI